MKATCSRSGLREALRIVSGVVDPRNIKPILKDIRLRTVEGALELSATDLEVGIKYFVRDVEVTEEGGLVVPADPLNGIVTESREERLALSLEESVLVVRGQGSKFNIMGVSEEEFPDIPDFPSENSLDIEGAILGEMIEKTIFAVAVEKQRYALNGILFEAKEKSPRLTMVGTDGRRLAMIKRKANSASPFSCSVIIPVKALQQLQKMADGQEIVKINVMERRVLFRTEDAVLVAQLVEGRFPPYREVVPDDHDKKLEISSEEFANAIRQAAVLSARESRAVCLSMKGDSMIVESSSAESGEAHVEIPVKFEGDPLEIRFNSDFLLDGLKVVGDEQVRFGMKDAARAAVLKTGGGYLYLIMPITQD